MKFLDIVDITAINNVSELKYALKVLVGSYIDAFWSSYDNSKDSSFAELRKEVEEIPSYSIELEYSKCIVREGVNEYEYEITFDGTDWGCYSIIVRWSFFNRLMKSEVKLDGKEVKEFDARIGHAIYKVVAAAMFHSAGLYVREAVVERK